MPTSRSEEPWSFVLLAMQDFTLWRPPFDIRNSTNLLNAELSLAVTPYCFTIEDSHWATVQSGCKKSSENELLLLRWQCHQKNIVSSIPKPQTEFEWFLHTHSVGHLIIDPCNVQQAAKKKHFKKLGSRHVGLPSSISLVLSDAVDQSQCQPKCLLLCR